MSEQAEAWTADHWDKLAQSRKEMEQYKTDFKNGILQCTMVHPSKSEYGYLNCGMRVGHSIPHRDCYGYEPPQEEWMERDLYEATHTREQYRIEQPCTEQTK